MTGAIAANQRSGIWNITTGAGAPFGNAAPKKLAIRIVGVCPSAVTRTPHGVAPQMGRIVAETTDGSVVVA